MNPELIRYVAEYLSEEYARLSDTRTCELARNIFLLDLEENLKEAVEAYEGGAR